MFRRPNLRSDKSFAFLFDTADMKKIEIAGIVDSMQFRNHRVLCPGYKPFVTASTANHFVAISEAFGSVPDKVHRVFKGLCKTDSMVKGFYLCGGTRPVVFDVVLTRVILANGHMVIAYIRTSPLGAALKHATSHNTEEVKCNVLGTASGGLAPPSNVHWTDCVYLPGNLPPR